jgi:hypothetical protein
MKNFFKGFLPPNPAKLFMRSTRDFIGLQSPSLKHRKMAKKAIEAMGEGLYGNKKATGKAK